MLLIDVSEHLQQECHLAPLIFWPLYSIQNGGNGDVYTFPLIVGCLWTHFTPVPVLMSVTKALRKVLSL